jgi:rubrerythrin
MTPEDILKKAIEMEREAIETYNQMKKDVDPDTADLLEFLISQEKEHIKLLNERLKAVRLLQK